MTEDDLHQPAHDHLLEPLKSTRGTTATFAAASELLRALSAPIRAQLVSLLDEHGALCVHELVEALDVAQPLVSQHLRILRGAGVVIGERRGREVEYRLADDHIAHIVNDAVTHSQEPDPAS
ncbi:ArsR family transcriptional regulator [Antricoccus suffuscus]|uniref:ArsR family transcriptional regulator n=1 Tax=Antricoccus suffuscus TaxID=1629062 RepID=A0A2T0Z5E0_9ACTN|nr:metalloregulator ArsR/SmtB family transcription factor [Antricoccus suffuscus]PRZ31378.1 ArsR family transcriptional regulator [Antricoccus suffuscus]